MVIVLALCFQNWSGKCKLKFATCTAVVFIVLPVLFGCSNSSERTQKKMHRAQQIRTVNETIDKWNPKNTRISRSIETAKVKITGFDFLKQRSVTDFPELFSVANRITESNLLKEKVIGDGTSKWIADQKPGSVYYGFDTDLWNLGDGSTTMDLLIVACVDGKVTNWRLFAICPY